MLQCKMEAGQGRANSFFRTLLDHIDCGLIVCDEHGSIEFLNGAAARALRTGEPLSQSGGQLRCTQPEQAALWSALVTAAQRGRRQLVRLSGGSHGRQIVSVLPLGEPGLVHAMVLLVLGRPPCSALGMELFGVAHGLTRAERRVLACLVEERSPKETASHLGVALSTVRTQIRAAQEKLGVHSIEALVLRAAEVPPVADATLVTLDPVWLGSQDEHSLAA